MKKIICTLLFVAGLAAFAAVILVEPVTYDPIPRGAVVAEKRPDLGKISVAYVENGKLTFAVLRVSPAHMNRAVVGKPFP